VDLEKVHKIDEKLHVFGLQHYLHVLDDYHLHQFDDLLGLEGLPETDDKLHVLGLQRYTHILDDYHPH